MSESRPPRTPNRLADAPPAPEETMRAPPRAADPREEAAKRAAAIRKNFSEDSEGDDKFFIAPEKIPDGWSYEWKRNTIFGKEDPTYNVELMRRGWTTVPASRHPELMPSNWKGINIERDGLILMERPSEITDDVRRAERVRARAQVKAKEEQLNEAAPGHFERVDGKGQSTVKVRKSVEPIPIPE